MNESAPGGCGWRVEGWSQGEELERDGAHAEGMKTGTRWSDSGTAKAGAAERPACDADYMKERFVDLPLVQMHDESFPDGADTSHYRRLYGNVVRRSA